MDDAAIQADILVTLGRDAELVREATVQLMLAAVATALCMVERNYGRAAEPAKPDMATELLSAVPFASGAPASPLTSPGTTKSAFSPGSR